MSGIKKKHKTGVINDPLGQPTVPAGSDCRLILKFCAGRTDGRTDNMCENNEHYRPGLWLASWINYKYFHFYTSLPYITMKFQIMYYLN